MRARRAFMASSAAAVKADGLGVPLAFIASFRRREA
jgi:hypothetical protein